MKMPISEIADRYTITKLKSERTGEDVSEELECYRKELKPYGEALNNYIDRLYDVNGRLWDTEVQAARGASSEQPPLEEIGRLALKVREINCERNGIKAEVVEQFSEGFKEIKINYKKVDYGTK